MMKCQPRMVMTGGMEKALKVKAKAVYINARER